MQTVGSDHVPIIKTGKSLWEERPGFAGLATMLPVLLTEGVLKGRITLEKVAELTALNPAKLFGYYPQKGSIAVGSDADLVVVDLEREAVVGPETTPQPLQQRLRWSTPARLARADGAARRGDFQGRRGHCPSWKRAVAGTELVPP